MIAEIAVSEVEGEQPKWTSQRRFIATAWHVNHKWGVSQRPFQCDVCRVVFKVGDGARWICATAHGVYNFFVCDHCDTSDVLETWKRMTRLAQQDEYDLAAQIIKLESNLMRCVAVESRSDCQCIAYHKHGVEHPRGHVESGCAFAVEAKTEAGT